MYNFYFVFMKWKIANFPLPMCSRTLAVCIWLVGNLRPPLGRYYCWPPFIGASTEAQGSTELAKGQRVSEPV